MIEWLHRPFLYCVLHHHHSSQRHPPSSLPTDVPPTIAIATRKLAQRGVDASAALIRLVAAHHRHGGIWGLVRRSFGCALLLVAVATTHHHHQHQHREGDDDDDDDGVEVFTCVRPPHDWARLARLAAATARRWEGPGTRDLAWMRRTLEGLVDAAEASMSTGSGSPA